MNFKRHRWEKLKSLIQKCTPITSPRFTLSDMVIPKIIWYHNFWISPLLYFPFLVQVFRQERLTSNLMKIHLQKSLLRNERTVTRHSFSSLWKVCSVSSHVTSIPGGCATQFAISHVSGPDQFNVLLHLLITCGPQRAAVAGSDQCACAEFYPMFF